MRKLISIALFMFFTLVVSAQKTARVKVDYTYYAEPSENIESAEYNAFEQGKIQAIASEFGTIVSSTTSTILKSAGIDGNEIDDFMQLGSSEVKGEWIETKVEPQYDIQTYENKFSVHVTAEGVIREIITAPIDFKARILCNGTDDKFENQNFRNGDDIYVSFASPVEGYLTIYLLDNNRNAYCLLPYQNQKNGACHVNASQRYVFFSPSLASEGEKSFVDEYTMTADSELERNQIYVIFSPNLFTKATDKVSGMNSDGLQLPRQLSYKDFQKWLAKCRKYDTLMQIEKTIVNIKK